MADTDQNRLKYACDAGILSTTLSAPQPHTEDSNNPPSSDSESCESPRLTDLTASFRVFSESLAGMGLAEMEMIKAREASRWEAEKRRMESEAELTRMMLQTQLQIASLVAGKGPGRKRKRVEEEDESLISRRQCLFIYFPLSILFHKFIFQWIDTLTGLVYICESREGALLLSLIQCNFMF